MIDDRDWYTLSLDIELDTLVYRSPLENFFNKFSFVGVRFSIIRSSIESR